MALNILNMKRIDILIDSKQDLKTPVILEQTSFKQYNYSDLIKKKKKKKRKEKEEMEKKKKKL